MKILLIGVNGFIGSNLAQAILEQTDWDVYGMDLYTNYITHILDHPRFHFTEGDLRINNEWVEYHIKKCDAVVPLVAIAQPKLYVEDPLRVFELDFEENLKVVRWVHKHDKWVIFPSTSEVYGMCDSDTFDEEDSNFVYGPTEKTRWIYACSKQLLDRVIWAYGRDRKMKYTIFRPFNWVGPKLDSLAAAKNGNCRVVTQFIYNLLNNQSLKLVGGGLQSRTFTDVNDGIDALLKILSNPDVCHNKIYNIGTPGNTHTIAETAEIVREEYSAIMEIPIEDLPPIEAITENDFYGDGLGYQEILHRRPSIKRATNDLDWNPSITLRESVGNMIRSFCLEQPGDGNFESETSRG